MIMCVAYTSSAIPHSTLFFRGVSSHTHTHTRTHRTPTFTSTKLPTNTVPRTYIARCFSSLIFIILGIGFISPHINFEWMCGMAREIYSDNEISKWLHFGICNIPKTPCHIVPLLLLQKILWIKISLWQFHNGCCWYTTISTDDCQWICACASQHTM